MNDRFIFRVQILEGKGFGEDPQTLLCSAQFAGVVKTTQYSVNTDAHIWNSTLTWDIGREELRKAQATGSSHCKVSVLRKDGTRLGWVVVSLRSARLQSLYKSDPQGQWLQLNASKLLEPPQLRVSYALCEERLLTQLDQPLGTANSVTTGPSQSSGAKSTSSSQSLRRLSSSSAAAASLRPSKSLSIKQQPSEVELSSSRDVPEPTESEVAAAAGTYTAADDETAAIEAPSTTDAEGTNKLSVSSTAEQTPGTPDAVPPLQQQQELSQQERPAADDVLPVQVQPQGTNSGQASSITDAPTELQGGIDTGTTEATETTLALEETGPIAASPQQQSSVPDVTTRQQSRDELVAAAEASLPTFALRQQQQQLVQRQQAKQRLEQHHQQPLQQQTPEAQPVQSSRQPVSSRLQQEPEHAIGSEPSNLSPATDAVQPLQALANNTHGNNETQTQGAVDVATAAVPTSTSAAAAADASSLLATDPVRQFAFTLDVRSFQAGRRLPLALASAYVTAFLPPELVAFLTTTCGAKIPPKLTPLRTVPAVEVLRGSEGGLPHGCASVSFNAGVVALAGLLAQEPRVVLEVWHKEKLRSDVLLGVASVSLSALLQECWVDGYAPVYALMTKATSDQEVEEKVQVGLLRVVLSLEDQGAPALSATPAANADAISSRQLWHSSSSSMRSPTTTPSKSSRQLTPPRHIQPPGKGLITANASPIDGAQPHAQRQQQLQQGLAARPGAAAATNDAKNAAAALGMSQLPEKVDGRGLDGMPVAASSGAKQMPELMAAWELEVWKKAEEARFKAQLQELEQQRMSVIEAQWWKRERARETEISAMKAEYARLEQQTKALLAVVQERESKLITAEADLRRRQEDLERQQAARMSEAEAAVRRLQVECEHQLSLERDRTAAVARQRDAAETRLLAAEARAAAMEAQFAEYRAAHHATPEAQLQLQLQQAQAAAAAADARAVKAVKAKKHYKEQVLQLARELAAVHQQRQQDLVVQQKQQQEEAKAKEQSSAAVAQAVELADLRQQLTALRMAAMAAAAAETSGRSRSPSSSELSHQQHQQQRRKHRIRHIRNKENEERYQKQEWAGGMVGVDQHARDKQHVREGRLHAGHQDVEVYADDEQQWWSNDQQDSDGSESGSSSGGSSSDEEKVERPARHRHANRLQQLKRQQHQRHQRQQAFAAGPEAGAAGAAADAALAEVAALAAILNQPQPAAAQAAVQQHESVSADRQVQQPGQVSAATAADDDAQEAAASGMSSQLQQPEEQHLEATASNKQQLQPPSPHVDSLSEVRRLLKEKVELLSSGLYNRDDAVILQIDARVQELAEQQMAG